MVFQQDLEPDSLAADRQGWGDGKREGVERSHLNMIVNDDD